MKPKTNMSTLNHVMVLWLLSTLSSAISMTPGDDEQKEKTVVCTTEACQKRAKLIIEYRNKTADPCDNFYWHACGGWIEKYKQNGTYDVFQQLRISYGSTLTGILGSLLSAQDKKGVINKAAKLYRACYDVPKGNDHHEAMLDIMKLSGLMGWPVINEETRLSKVSEVLKLTGMSPFVIFSVAKGNNDTAANIIRVSLQNSVEKSKDSMIKAALLLANPNISAEDQKIVTERLLELEERLEKALDAVPRYPGKLPAPYFTTLSALERDFPDFPLRDCLKKEFDKVNISLHNEEPIEVYTKDGYGAITKFLLEANPTTLFNYIGLKIMLNWAPHASETFGNPPSTPRHHRGHLCFQLLNTGMKYVVPYLYSKANISPEGKSQVQDIVKGLKEALKKTINNLTWMDPETKNMANRKVDKMVSKIGYPSWFLNEEVLEDHYKYMPDFNSSTPFVEMLYHAVENNNKKNMENLHQPYDSDEDWFFILSSVTAHYIANMNALVFPLGAFQAPFHGYEVPKSLNYGSAGVTIAHEMAHAIFGKGSRYDEYGRPMSWWTNKTQNDFRDRAVCFYEQYNKIIEEQSNLTIDGWRTWEENVADNAGIQLAFKAYTQLLESQCEMTSTRLERVENVSARELFFIGDAMVWCSVSDYSAMKYKIQNTTHSPNMYRVNTPMQNFPEFAKAFNCSAGTGMNPEKGTCSIW